MRELQEKDFYVLRNVFVSGRHDPDALAGIMPLAVVMQALTCFLTYVVAGDATYYPSFPIIVIVYLIFSFTLTILAIVYMFSNVYMKRQKMQYFITILLIQNIGGVCMLLMGLFTAAKDPDFPALSFTVAVLLLGAAVLTVTWVRFKRLLHAGAYREGSVKAEQRNNMEYSVEAKKQVAKWTVLAIVAVGVIMSYVGFGEFTFLIVLSIILFCAMLFVLPEQLVLLYCKHRFSSFNYRLNGKLYPFGYDDMPGAKPVWRKE